jgi:hypothetical protein
LPRQKPGGDEIDQPVGKQVELFRTIEARLDDPLRPRLENERRDDGRGKGEEEEHGDERKASLRNVSFSVVALAWSTFV